MIKILNNAPPKYAMTNTLKNSSVKSSVLKWCRNLIISTMISSRHRCRPHESQLNGIDGHYCHITQ